MDQPTDDSERDSDTHNGRQAIITVEWAAVEDDIGGDVEPDLRRKIEHTGATNERFLASYGYDGSVSLLVDTLREHKRLRHPNRGALESRYAPLPELDRAVGTLERLRDGGSYVFRSIVENGDDALFIDGLADLYDAARALDERRDDWDDDYHPRLAFASSELDQLGDLHVLVKHPDREVIENLDVTDLPIEPYTFPWNSGKQCVHHELHGDDYYWAEFRHERYYQEEEPTIADERAEEIGFLGGGIALLSFEQLFADSRREYSEIEAPDVDSLPDSLSLYEYVEEESRETHYEVEWIEHYSANDSASHYLLFDREPTESDIETALLINQSQRSDDRNR